MITLFSIPKPFEGHIAIIQRNAIQSWKLLHPDLQIILFANEPGTAETAKEFDITHVPDVATNEYGTPLINDIFKQAETLAKYPYLCYVNTDIILMNDLITAFRRVRSKRRKLLLVGRRWDVSIDKPLDMGFAWESKLREFALQNGELHAAHGIDYFLFKKGLWKTIPPFAIGRSAWDNWLLYAARTQGARMIDLTPVVLALHQNHDYAHHPEGKDGVFYGEEAKRNQQYVEGLPYFSIADATHQLSFSTLRRTLRDDEIKRHLHTLPFIHPKLSRFVPLFHQMLYYRGAIRKRIQKLRPSRNRVQE